MQWDQNCKDDPFDSEGGVTSDSLDEVPAVLSSSE